MPLFFCFLLKGTHQIITNSQHMGCTVPSALLSVSQHLWESVVNHLYMPDKEYTYASLRLAKLEALSLGFLVFAAAFFWDFRRSCSRWFPPNGAISSFSGLNQNRSAKTTLTSHCNLVNVLLLDAKCGDEFGELKRRSSAFGRTFIYAPGAQIPHMYCDVHCARKPFKSKGVIGSSSSNQS